MDSSGNISSADFLKYTNGQTLTTAWVSPGPAGTSDGKMTTKFGNPCDGAITINALPAVPVQRYNFTGMTSGSECRARASGSTSASPWADAGAAQNVTAGAVVTLDGSASLDTTGTPLTYAWTLTSKPAGSAATLSSATAVKPTFTADVAGSYVVNLIVNDGKNSSAAASTSVVAASGTSFATPPQPPG
jgi:hypothetical protein